MPKCRQRRALFDCPARRRNALHQLSGPGIKHILGSLLAFQPGPEVKRILHHFAPLNWARMRWASWPRAGAPEGTLRSWSAQMTGAAGIVSGNPRDVVTTRRRRAGWFERSVTSLIAP